MGLQLYPGIEDSRMVLPNIAMEQVPFIFGLFIMGSIIAAGASTADSGILGVPTVFGRNIFPETHPEKNGSK